VKNRPYFSKRKEIAMTRLLKRRDFLKGLGLGVGAVALGGSSWAYAQTGKEMIIGKPSPAHPIYELARYFAREKILKPVFPSHQREVPCQRIPRLCSTVCLLHGCTGQYQDHG
jgi:hypothetical protein